MKMIPPHTLARAKAQYLATMTPENRIVRDDTITPYVMAMKLAGFRVVTDSWCNRQTCPHCRGAYSAKYRKGSSDYWSCPHCNTIDEIGNDKPITGKAVATLMRRHRCTIRELKARMGITMKRIREIRNGIGLTLDAARDWAQAITGTDPGEITSAEHFDSL